MANITSTQHKPILALSQEKKFTSKGVGYNNKDNRDNRDNKDNICDRSSSWPQAATPPFNDPSILSSSQEVAKPKSILVMEAPTPETSPIHKAFVHRALFTLFDNGENSTQRYKFQVTINPAEEKNTRHEFISSLTKDLRNFKKYLPQGIDYEAIKEGRKLIKEQHGSYPYMGKLHYNEGWKPGAQRTQNEPECFVLVWYDPVEKGWDFYLQMYAWEHKGSLYSNNLNKTQKLRGVKATDIWFNPDYHHEQLHKRNKTFAERMNGK